MYRNSIEEDAIPDELESPEEIKSGSLAISNANDSALQQDLWVRPATSARPLCNINDNCTICFEILKANIMPAESVDNNLKRYVVYEVSVRRDGNSVDLQASVIHRRYTDFRYLYINLKRDYPNEMSKINFPSKVVVGNFSSLLIAERSSAFENFLTYVALSSTLRDTPAFEHFIQNNELTKACQFLDERRTENAIPLLENSFFLSSKVFMDRSRPILLLLCRLVAACTITPLPHQSADRWATLALTRYNTLCDVDLLSLYVPLLHTCAHLWWQQGRDQKSITDRLTEMSKRGINTSNVLTLTQAIHKLDPRTETF